MKHSIEPRDSIYVKGYGFMSFARSMSNNQGKKLVDTAKKSATDTVKPTSKRAIQKTAEASGDLKDNKPDTKKKDNKPDTSKSNIENRVSNRIKYKIQDFAKYRKVLIEMIDERVNMLDLTNLWLAESISNIDIDENVNKFTRLCNANRIKTSSWNMLLIAHIYAVNVALECLRDGVENGIWPKGVSYNLITIPNEWSVRKYYNITIYEKKILVKAAHEEIEMFRRLIETNIPKYENIIKGAGEMDIHALDQLCADIDKTIGYIRKMIIMIPSIAEKNENRYDKRK